ncbi:MAG: hypothetical protein R2880_11620 [Deinococcales bacterium]
MTLKWSYHVIRLEELAAKRGYTDNVALISLIGLCKFEDPKRELGLAVERIKQEADNEEKRQLFNILISLINDKELAKMIQEWSKTDEFIRSLPMAQLFREEGKEEGKEEGTLKTLRENIIRVC